MAAAGQKETNREEMRWPHYAPVPEPRSTKSFPKRLDYEPKELLRKEKEFSRLRDDFSRQRRELPWEKVERNNVFDGPNGKPTLSDLFDGKSQLIIYHFMFGPGWEQGCPSCSFVADHMDSTLIHLAHRDVSLAVISRAPLEQIQAFKSVWAGASPGSRLSGTTSTMIITFRSAKRKWRTARSTTTMAYRTPRSKNFRAQVCSIRMLPERSSTPTPLTPADSTSCWHLQLSRPCAQRPQRGGLGPHHGVAPSP